jgi:hypothetical protein
MADSVPGDGPRPLLASQETAELPLIKVEDDRPIDVERGRDQVTLTPFPDLVQCAGRGIDIDFRVRQMSCLQPGPRPAAIRTPSRAVHHDPAMGQVNRQGLRGFPRRSLGVDTAKLGEQHFIVGLVIDVMDVDVADDPAPVEDEQGAFGVAFGSQDAVLTRNRTMWPEVAQERVVHPSKALCPRLEAGHMVNADAQNLGIQSRELGVFSLVGRDLAASNGGPGQREEGKDHVLSPQVTQGDVLVQVTGQRELRGFLSDSKDHGLVLSRPDYVLRNCILTAIGPTVQEALWNLQSPFPAIMTLGRCPRLTDAIQ